MIICLLRQKIEKERFNKFIFKILSLSQNIINTYHFAIVLLAKGKSTDSKEELGLEVLSVVLTRNGVSHLVPWDR